VVEFSRDLQSSMQRWVEQMGGTRLALGAAIVILAAVAITFVARSGKEDDAESVDSGTGVNGPVPGDQGT
jgi:hypothetical protein